MKKEILYNIVTVDDEEYEFVLNHVEMENGVAYLIEIRDEMKSYIVESHELYFKAVEGYRKLVINERDGYNRGIVQKFFK